VQDQHQTALSTDEGFMRGARIAEKIQEYYHQNQSNRVGHATSQSQNTAQIVKPYADGGAKKSVRQKPVVLGASNVRMNSKVQLGPQQMNWTGGAASTTSNRVSRSSHGSTVFRGRTTAS
jgi:hypothetical protein